MSLEWTQNTQLSTSAKRCVVFEATNAASRNREVGWVQVHTGQRSQAVRLRLMHDRQLILLVATRVLGPTLAAYLLSPYQPALPVKLFTSTRVIQVSTFKGRD
ncbi:uncharacterized protein G2W53_025322 [Senna tora]|uniref:Uncharacterized protein n=1 Tax=Senna tora TaxID=362788 RepID=A0A834TCZ5_9FABA|nr:uncharacterized protein G2W53_025322 [Senna tora]